MGTYHVNSWDGAFAFRLVAGRAFCEEGGGWKVSDRWLSDLAKIRLIARGNLSNGDAGRSATTCVSR